MTFHQTTLAGRPLSVRAVQEPRLLGQTVPRGDGITIDLLNDQPAEQIVRDIGECFGWEVRMGFPH